MRPPHIVAVHAFFTDQDGRTLLIRRANTGYMDGWFGVPAGHVEPLEFVGAALVREMQEEVGVVVPGYPELMPVHVMHRLKPDDFRIDYFYVIKKWQGEIHNNEPEKCSEMLWAEPKNLPEKVIPYIRFALEKIQAGEMFSEFVEPERE
jgi:ADP-ribose pyrophosphatase YjhB (NUDIX family)